MSEVEQLAQEQFDTFKTRLCEILSEVEEEIKSSFQQGYAKGETDEKFRTKPIVIDNSRTLAKDLIFAKTIIKDLLDNSDEYTRQRAMDFLKEKNNA